MHSIYGESRRNPEMAQQNMFKKITLIQKYCFIEMHFMNINNIVRHHHVNGARSLNMRTPYFSHSAA